jgi:hypothetical protein
MDFLEWATSPWGQTCPDSYCLVLDLGRGDRRVSLLYCSRHLPAIFRQEKESLRVRLRPLKLRSIPERVPRHSLTARLFHWIMAAAMFTLLFTAFLPKVGIQFPWVTYHWIAGCVNRIHHFSHHSRVLFYGFLGDLAGPD